MKYNQRRVYLLKCKKSSAVITEATRLFQEFTSIVGIHKKRKLHCFSLFRRISIRLMRNTIQLITEATETRDVRNDCRYVVTVAGSARRCIPLRRTELLLSSHLAQNKALTRRFYIGI